MQPHHRIDSTILSQSRFTNQSLGYGNFWRSFPEAQSRTTQNRGLCVSSRKGLTAEQQLGELSVRVSRYSELRPRLRVWRSTGPPPSDHSPTNLPDPRHQVTVCSSTKSVVIRLVNFSESCCVACPSGEANALFMLSLSSNHNSTIP